MQVCVLQASEFSALSSRLVLSGAARRLTARYKALGDGVVGTTCHCSRGGVVVVIVSVVVSGSGQRQRQWLWQW